MRNARNFASIVFKPIWKLVFAGPPFLYGWFALIRDDFLPQELSGKLRLGGVFSMIDWYWWVIAGLFVWGSATALEAAKRITKLSLLQPNIETDGIEEEEFQIYVREYKKTKNRNASVIISRSFTVGESDDDYNYTKIPIPKANANFRIMSKPDGLFVRYYLCLKNIGHKGINPSDTEYLHAKFVYFDWNGNELFRHEEPFWQDKPRSASVKLIANGNPEKLCIAIRKKEDSQLYAFCSNKSYPKNSLEPIQENLLLGDDIIIKVQLCAGNIKDMNPIWIETLHGGMSKRGVTIYMDIRPEPEFARKRPN